MGGPLKPSVITAPAIHDPGPFSLQDVSSGNTALQSQDFASRLLPVPLFGIAVEEWFRHSNPAPGQLQEEKVRNCLSDAGKSHLFRAESSPGTGKDLPRSPAPSFPVTIWKFRDLPILPAPWD